MIETQVTIEHEEGTNVCIYNKPGKHLKQEHLRLFSGEIIEIAKDRDLNFTDLRVLMAVIGLMRFDNVLKASKDEIGKQINIERPNVSKSIKKLVEKGFLTPIDNEGPKIIYMVNPDLAFKARASNYKTLKRCWDEKLYPNTKKMGIVSEGDLDLYDKLDDKIASLAKRTGIPEDKVKLLIESLLDDSSQKSKMEAANAIMELALNKLHY
jgi:DNA-binding MarR family transcriptional regulator